LVHLMTAALEGIPATIRTKPFAQDLQRLFFGPSKAQLQLLRSWPDAASSGRKDSGKPVISLNALLQSR
jgi:hypothetical protein